jgi:preprotein translocase subunit SecG
VGAAEDRLMRKLLAALAVIFILILLGIAMIMPNPSYDLLRAHENVAFYSWATAVVAICVFVLLSVLMGTARATIFVRNCIEKIFRAIGL